MDKRPDPKPRKHERLWQAYLWWEELQKMKVRHQLRISSIERGKSGMSGIMEKTWMETLNLEALVEIAKKEMIAIGESEMGEIWHWMVAHKGIGEHTAAKILSQLDDVANFDTISKMWRYSGVAVMDGKAERCKKGEKSPFNRQLKSYLLGEKQLAQQFILHHTPYYYEKYTEFKDKLRMKHPEPVPDSSGPWKHKYTDSHLDRMAKRKIVKLFLSHLWVAWRTLEGLPVSDPYAQAILGHTNIDSVPEV